MISTHLQEFFTLNNLPETNPCTLWNTHKAFVRGLLIKLGSRAKKQYNAKVDKLISEIQSLETRN